MTDAAYRKRSQYRQLGLVGYGQFGRVFCAINRQTGELVALKDIPRNRLSTHKFLRELRFLLSLEHPHIAACQALEHSDTGRQLVLDYCEGGTLRNLLNAETPLTLAEIIDFLLQILAALEHAHSQGIVHCDIKPENILLVLVPGGWRIKISDFGIARLKREAKTESTGHTGSPAYMAPERFYNQYSGASDLYAAGVIFYELLLGKRPFSGTPLELMVAHLNLHPEIPTSLPESIRSVLTKGLEKLLARRYRTATEMAAALRELRQSLCDEKLHCPLRQAPVPAKASALPFTTLPHLVETLGITHVMPSLQLEAAQTPTRVLVTYQGQKVWYYHWPHPLRDMKGASQGFELQSPIRNFLPVIGGGYFITDSSVHRLIMGQGLATVARFNHPVVVTLSPNMRWLAAYWINSQNQAELILRYLHPSNDIVASVPRKVPLGVVTELLSDLTAIDNHHLLVATRSDHHTRFQLFSRKGQLITQLSLGTAVRRLIPTTVPYQYLTVESGYPNNVLRIDLKPFRVFRYRLDIEAVWMMNTAAGYGVLNRQGQLRLISDEGQIIAQLDDLPPCNAVLQVAPMEFLLVASETECSRIYYLNLKSLDLGLIC